jgi:hypothetical protein
MAVSLVPARSTTLVGPPPVRQWNGTHGAEDGFDADRVKLVRDRWSGQNAALLRRDRTIEENIRMLAGRQWDVWSPVYGSFVDPTRYMSDSERRWRQRPVVNLLQYWFLMTHARVTETPPIITFQPASADRKDAQLAEVMDTVFKTLWLGDLNMDDVTTRAAAWLIAAGETYLETCAEYGSDQFMLKGPATLSMQAQDGSTIERDTGEPVPYGRDGVALASLVEQDGGEYGYDVPDFDAEGYEGESPAYVHEGTPKVNVYSPLEIRAEWGANIPWIDKRWIVIRRYLPVEVVKARWGIEVVADSTGAAGDISGGAGALQSMLFGAGHFQAVGNNTMGSGDDQSAAESYVTVDTMWEKPTEQTPEDQDEEFPAGGRLLIVTPTHVLHDSMRPFKTKAAGPIQRAQFVQMPGRAGLGSTPLEQMVPIQKTYNRGWAQILEHRNRCTNPILVCDENSGVSDQVTNLPGQKITADFGVSQQPAYYLSPPALPGDVWRTQEMLFDLLMRLGSISGSDGQAPTDDASGELVAQLRFNSDRPVSIAVRSMAYALAGVADDLVAVLPTCWPADKIITTAGEDNVLRTVSVLPEMWDGHVNVRPDITSAIPESQPARQAKLERWWMQGAFGDPMTQGRQTFLEMVNFPNIARALRAEGGVDKVTCERFLTMLSQGAPAQSIPLIPQYNYQVFIGVTRDHMAAPEFLQYEEPVKKEFLMFFEILLMAAATAAQMAASAQAPVASAGAALEGHVASVAQANGPADPSGQSLTHGGPPESGPPKAS